MKINDGIYFMPKMISDSLEFQPARKRKSWLLFFFLFTLALGFSIYYFSEIKKEIFLLEKINAGWLMAAVVAQCLTYLFTAFIYHLLLQTQHPEVMPKLSGLLKASVISLFFNQTIPSAGISGNSFFYRYLSKFMVKGNQILRIILAELVIFYLAMVFLILALLCFCLLYLKNVHPFVITLSVGLLVYSIFMTLILLSGRRKSIQLISNKIQQNRLLRKLLTGKTGSIQLQNISALDMQLISFWNENKKKVILTFITQLVVILADACTLYALFLGLGVSVSLFTVLLTLISTKIISIIPFLPGSLVLYETGMSFYFASLGLPLAAAVIATLVYRLLSFWLPMPFGLYFYRKWTSG